jgi:hypothetical protein
VFVVKVAATHIAESGMVIKNLIAPVAPTVGLGADRLAVVFDGILGVQLNALCGPVEVIAHFNRASP